MAGTKEGAEKRAAERAGVSVGEFRRLVTNGRKWCWDCREWKAVSAFGSDASRVDGLTSRCGLCKNTAGRRLYVPHPQKVTKGRRFKAPRDGDKSQARHRVSYLVFIGNLPKANSLPCADCGHIWGSDGKRHEYDHFRGYSIEHQENVQAVCSMCHHRRAEERGEVFYGR